MELKLGGIRGGHAIVDADKYEDLCKYKWTKNPDGYIRGNVNEKTMYMHRFLLQANADDIVDHINNIPYDNRIENLRIVSSSQNSFNRRKQNNTTSIFKGVHFDLRDKKYLARLTINKKPIDLGRYDNESQAAEAVDMFLINSPDHGYPYLNYPDKKDEYLKRKYSPYIPRQKRLYQGVQKCNMRYRADIGLNGKTINIGRSINQVECSHLYDKYIVDNKIPNKTLNHPGLYPNYDPRIIKTDFEIVDNSTIRLINNNLEEENVLIDKEDYDKIKYYKWYISSNKYILSIVDGNTTRLHRYLMNISDSNIYIDHIDNNPHNNKKSNLRISDAIKNAQNKGKRPNTNTNTKFIGIYFRGNRWKSSIGINGKSIIIGYDTKEINSARRRDLWIIENLKDQHYKLNFEWASGDIVKWKKILNEESTFADCVSENTKYCIKLIQNNDLKLADKIFTSIMKKSKQQSKKDLELIERMDQKYLN